MSVTSSENSSSHTDEREGASAVTRCVWRGSHCSPVLGVGGSGASCSDRRRSFDRGRKKTGMRAVEEAHADCRICLESSPKSMLVAPCECTGTCRYVHRECLERWVVERGSCRCEVCKAPREGT